MSHAVANIAAAREALPAPETASTAHETTTQEAAAPVATLETPHPVRAEIKAPESSAAVKESMTLGIMPQEPHVPAPLPQSFVPVNDAVTREIHARDVLIEQHLASYFGQHLPADLKQGLDITVMADPSNRISANTPALNGQMDVSIVFNGPALESHATANALRDAVMQALNAHPAFTGYNLSGAGKDVLHTLNIGMNGLSKERFAELLKPQLTLVTASPDNAAAETTSTPIHTTVASSALPAQNPPANVISQPVIAQDTVASLANDKIVGTVR